MAKILGSLGLMLLACVVVLIWCLHVPAYDHLAALHVLQSDRDRAAARDRLPNGYADIASVLAHDADQTRALLHSQDDVGALVAAREKDRLTLPYRALDRYSTSTRAGDQSKLHQSVTEAARYLGLFRTVLPRIKSMLAKPVFAPPAEGARSPMLLRSLALSLVVYGRQAELEHQPGVAADDYLLVARLGLLLRKQGPVTNVMLSHAITDAGLEALLQLLSEGTLPQADWRRVRDDVEGLPAQDDDLINAMDDEFAASDQMLETTIEGQRPQDIPGSAPGLVERLWCRHDLDLARWLYLRYRPALASLRFPPATGVDMDADASYLQWHLSMGEPYLAPDILQYIIEGFRADQTLVNATRMMLDLQAWRRDKGHWPDKLSDMGAAPPDLMAPDGQFTYRLGRDGPVLSSAGPRYHALHLKNRQFLPYRPAETVDPP